MDLGTPLWGVRKVELRLEQQPRDREQRTTPRTSVPPWWGVEEVETRQEQRSRSSCRAALFARLAM